MERLAALAVHAYTAVGAVLALLMVHFSYQGEVRTVLWLFLVAMVIDGSDGMVARRLDGSIAGIGDISAQTRQVCENVKAAVEAAGGTMDDICRVDVYVRNMEHFDQIHKVRREFFKPPAPASTMVEICKMTSPDYLIEINAIAVIAD